MPEQKNRHFSLLAFFQAVFVFIVLLLMLAATIVFYNFSYVDLRILSFILALACLVLIAKNIFDISNEGLLREKYKEQIELDTINQPSKRLFYEVYDNSLIAYLILNSDGKILSSNTSATRLLGRSAAKLQNANFFSCLKSDRADHIVLLSEKFRNGIVIADEEIQISSAKTKIWATLSILQFSNSVGGKDSLVTLVDVTKQKEIDVAKSEFVSLASHQLRTPIAGMRWSAELLLMDGAESLSSQQKRYVERLLSNIERMSQLVDDFLQVSRFDLGTRSALLEEVDIPKLIDSVINDQLVVSSGKRLRVEKNFDRNLKRITTDQNLLQIIITNLYTNAVKYSTLGGVVTVSYRQDGETMVLEVKDTGMGIPISEQAKIFTKVFRASNASREVPDGTGLGLYIVKKAIQVLRGRVSFISVENSGTTFTAVIPIAEN